MERISIVKGRGTKGILMGITYGSVIIALTVFLLIETFRDGFDGLFFFLFILCLLFMVLVVAFLYIAIRLKTLRISEEKIDYIVGKKRKWSVELDNIVELGTEHFGGKTPRSGYYLTDNKGNRYTINDRDDIPRKKVVHSFKLIYERTGKYVVKINDKLGWIDRYKMGKK